MFHLVKWQTLLAQITGLAWVDVVLFGESFAFEDSRARWLYSGITRGEAAALSMPAILPEVVPSM